MRFGPLPLEEARGKILAHNISDPSGRRVLRKGHPVDEDAVRTLRELGFPAVYVAELDTSDVPEDQAATRLAAVVVGPGVTASSAHTGRVNLTARALGVLQVRTETLLELNQIDGFTVATLATNSLVRPGERVATIKIIPYAVPWEAVARAEAMNGAGPVVAIREIEPRNVGIVLVGSPGAWPALRDGLGEAIRRRAEALGCVVLSVACAPLDDEELAKTLREQVSRGASLMVVAGETAIMDLDDVIPRGVRKAGGRVEHLGLAMDPGHLLLLAYLDDVPTVGAPGCVRGPSQDGFDVVLARLLSGERLTRGDLRALGHGGLLSNPRSR
jgi:molybdopterin biosynthesis enzyme